MTVGGLHLFRSDNKVEKHFCSLVGGAVMHMLTCHMHAAAAHLHEVADRSLVLHHEFMICEANKYLLARNTIFAITCLTWSQLGKQCELKLTLLSVRSVDLRTKILQLPRLKKIMFF